MGAPILIIDDDPIILGLLKERLRSHGYDARTADCGHDGMRLAAEIDPHLIILDVRMPNIDGWSLLHELRKSAKLKDIPIIISTAETELEDMFRAEGIAGYLTKPFNPDELLKMVQKALINNENKLSTH